MSALVTLTTDFGGADWFVASMKAVLLRDAPNAVIVDITHETPPGDVAHAAFVLSQCVDRFHGSAVHLAVVDPGVGGNRLPMAVRTPLGGWLVGPNNGIFTGVITSLGGKVKSDPEKKYLSAITCPTPKNFAVHAIKSPEWKSASVSRTFHGRDVFAFAAARLANGWNPSDFWPRIQNLEVINMPPPTKKGKTVVGMVQHIDRFGNLITDIPCDMLGSNAHLQEDGETFSEAESYMECGRLSWLRASHGFAEIASGKADASKVTRKKRGDQVVFLL